MWESVGAFVGPLVLGVVATMAIEAATGRAWGLVLRQAFKARARRRLKVLGSHGDSIVRGEEELYVIEFVPHGWEHDDLVIHERSWSSAEERLRTAPPSLLPDTADAIASAIDAKREQLQSQTDGAWNGPTIAVEAIQPGRRSGPKEDPTLTITVSPSDHAAATTSSGLWKQAFDDGRVSLPDDPHTPIPGLVHAIGLNATVVTDDDQLILVRRSPRTSSNRDGWHISVNEGMLPSDRDASRRLDPHLGLVRGVHEELGVEIPQACVHFHTAMFDVRRYQFGLLGHIDLKGTGIEASTFHAFRKTGLAQDKFENSTMVTIPWRFEPVFEKLSEPGWIEHGWLNLLLSAMEAFPRRRVELARLYGDTRQGADVSAAGPAAPGAAHRPAAPGAAFPADG